MTSENIEKGDIIYIELDSWILSPDGSRKLHETTHEGLSKQEKIHEEKKMYGEMPVVVGRDRLPKGLEESILGKSVGEEGKVVVPPEKGAGQRDPKLVSLHSIREFVKMNIEPAPGMPVVIGGRKGYVSAVTAGRVRVDFNSPLAGKTIEYSYKIVRKAETLEQKVQGIVDMDYGLGEQFKINVRDGEASIVVPDLCKTDERWFISKFRVIADLREMEELKKVKLVEEYEKKEEKKPEEALATPQGKESPPKERERPAKKERKVEEELVAEEKAPEEL